MSGPHAPAERAALTARGAGLAACRACGTLRRLAPGVAYEREPAVRCRRCGARASSRLPHSLQRTWAFLLVGLVAYVPANLAPVMLTSSITGDTSDTIMTGVLELVEHGSAGVAAVIFFASICIPVTKFVVVATLAASLSRPSRLDEHTRHRLHRVTELIGRWSMIDVFVIAVLAALIQLGAFVTIAPGIGIAAFAASVVFTMLAASSLDPRLFWDRA